MTQTVKDFFKGTRNTHVVSIAENTNDNIIFEGTYEEFKKQRKDLFSRMVTSYDVVPMADGTKEIGVIIRDNITSELSNMRNLAERIAKFFWDYDVYEFRDTFANQEEAINHIEEMLAKNEHQTLIEFCNDVLETDNDEMYEEANLIKNELLKSVTYSISKEESINSRTRIVKGKNIFNQDTYFIVIPALHGDYYVVGVGDIVKFYAEDCEVSMSQIAAKLILDLSETKIRTISYFSDGTYSRTGTKEEEITLELLDSICVVSGYYIPKEKENKKNIHLKNAGYDVVIEYANNQFSYTKIWHDGWERANDTEILNVATWENAVITVLSNQA